MSFDSIPFLFFLPLVVVAFYICPIRFRWALLLMASCYFYMAFVPKYILILFSLVCIDYTLAILMDKESGKLRHAYLVGSVLSNIGLLFVFKYFNFFNTNIELLGHALDWNYPAVTLRLLLPLGLSFHTFQSLSYVIEVYRRKYPAEKNLGVYALYVMFFPQMVAGPIERPQHLLEQLKRLYTRFDFENIFLGFRLIVWGFFKKKVIADRLALCVNYVWINYAHLSGPSILLAIVFFSFQLYADFSGYSDIARGSARMLGVDVIQNFRQPYFSRSTAEFWRRWHISLSSWFRDYVYIPLGGSLVTEIVQYRNIFVVFLVSGLWHGAAWTFVMMGFLFGLFVVLGTISKNIRIAAVSFFELSRLPRCRAFLQTLVTFALVSFAWVFFRAPSIYAAVGFLRQIFVGWGEPFLWFVQTYLQFPFNSLGMNRIDLLLSIASLIGLLIVEYMQTKNIFIQSISRLPLVLRSAMYAGLVLVVILFGIYTPTQFIYFQF